MSRITIVVISEDAKVKQVIGNTQKIDVLEKLLRQYGMKMFVRTGAVGILRGSKNVAGQKEFFRPVFFCPSGIPGIRRYPA